jgi:uncharacterized protein
VRWTWDPGKNHENRRKHHLGFATAQHVFDDPLAASQEDSYSLERRWRTIGRVGSVVLVVIHTWPDANPETGEEVGRIISARKATARERRAYEEDIF